MCSAIGLEYWSGCGSSSTLKPIPVRSCHSGPEKLLRLERLQARFVGHVEGRALVLLGGLDGAVRRVLRRTFGRGLDRGGLGLPEGRARVGELDALRAAAKVAPRPVPSSARPGRASAVAPPISTRR